MAIRWEFIAESFKCLVLLNRLDDVTLKDEQANLKRECK